MVLNNQFSNYIKVASSGAVILNVSRGFQWLNNAERKMIFSSFFFFFAHNNSIDYATKLQDLCNWAIPRKLARFHTLLLHQWNPMNFLAFHRSSMNNMAICSEVMKFRFEWNSKKTQRGKKSFGSANFLFPLSKNCKTIFGEYKLRMYRLPNTTYLMNKMELHSVMEKTCNKKNTIE